MLKTVEVPSCEDAWLPLLDAMISTEDVELTNPDDCSIDDMVPSPVEDTSPVEEETISAAVEESGDSAKLPVLEDILPTSEGVSVPEVEASNDDSGPPRLEVISVELEIEVTEADVPDDKVKLLISEDVGSVEEPSARLSDVEAELPEIGMSGVDAELSWTMVVDVCISEDDVPIVENAALLLDIRSEDIDGVWPLDVVMPPVPRLD